jgi:hypothetical protein
MAPDDYEFGGGKIEDWPENPLATVAAYLKYKYPEVRIWVTKTERPNENDTRITWYKANGSGNPIGESCATITISHDS